MNLLSETVLPFSMCSWTPSFPLSYG